MEHALVLHVDQPLRVCVPKVTLVRETEVDLGLIQWVGDLVGEDTCREARDDLLDASFMRRVQDIVVDEDVVAEERELQRVAESQNR